MKYPAKQSPYFNTEFISTGLPALDNLIAVRGGIPRRRVTEIYGNKSSAKTTLGLTIIAAAQKAGLKCVFADAESSLHFKYAEKLGVDLNQLTVLHCTHGEEYIEEIEELLEKEEADLIVVDSVDAIVPKAILEGTVDQQHIGAQARLIGKFMRKVVPLLQKRNSVLILLNHVKQSIMQYGSGEYTSGGKSLEYYTSLRLKTKMIGRIKSGDKTTGIKIMITVMKSKVGVPYGEVETTLEFNKGFSQEMDLIETALRAEIITKTGNTLFYGEIKLGVGLNKAKITLEENSELAEEIKNKL